MKKKNYTAINIIFAFIAIVFNIVSCMIDVIFIKININVLLSCLDLLSNAMVSICIVCLVIYYVESFEAFKMIGLLLALSVGSFLLDSLPIIIITFSFALRCTYSILKSPNAEYIILPTIRLNSRMKGLNGIFVSNT